MSAPFESSLALRFRTSALSLLQIFELQDRAEELASNLSYGHQRKLEIIRALATDPKVLLLDEPTRGIDIGAKSEIYQIIHNLAADGIAVIVVSSDLMEVMGIADRILVMSEGAITGELTRDEANEARLLQLALPRTRG